MTSATDPFIFKPSSTDSSSAGFQRLDLFPIPIFCWTWPDAQANKAAILEAIRKRRSNDPGVVRSNRDGWHSQKDLPIWPDPVIQALVRWCVRCAEESTVRWQDTPPSALFDSWRMNGWANVNPPGGAHNISHIHSVANWHLSACYYVDLPGIVGEDHGGALILEERGTGMNLSAAGRVSRRHRIVPKEGELIIFPSWLYHRVEEHDGSGDRVTIAFNLQNGALERARLWEHRPRWWWRRFPNVMRRLAKARGTPDLSKGAPPEGWEVPL